MPPSLWFKKSIQKPQVWELSRLFQETSMKFDVQEFGFSTRCRGVPKCFSLDDESFRWVPGSLVVHSHPGESQSSVSSCCDYPPPVCGPGSGHIGHVRIIRGTENTRDASFKENYSGTARSGTHILGSPLRLSLAITLYSREQTNMSGVHWFVL